jgi:ABC-2 type transport system permease protein
MISFFLKLFFKSFFDIKLGKIGQLIYELVAICLTLLVFNMTDQMVSPPQVNVLHQPYFIFLLIGEISLALPLSFYERMIDNFLFFHHNQFDETLNGININPLTIVIKKSLSELILPGLRVIMILGISTFFFELKFSITQLILFLFVQAIACVPMMIFAILSVNFYQTYKKGIKLFYVTNTLIAVLGGAYFPVHLLPSFFEKYLIWIFPQSFILNLSRLIFTAPLKQTLWVSVGLIIYSLVFYTLVQLFVQKLQKIKNAHLFKHVRFS